MVIYDQVYAYPTRDGLINHRRWLCLATTRQIVQDDLNGKMINEETKLKYPASWSKEEAERWLDATRNLEWKIMREIGDSWWNITPAKREHQLPEDLFVNQVKIIPCEVSEERIPWLRIPRNSSVLKSDYFSDCTFEFGMRLSCLGRVQHFIWGANWDQIQTQNENKLSLKLTSNNNNNNDKHASRSASIGTLMNVPKSQSQRKAITVDGSRVFIDIARNEMPQTYSQAHKWDVESINFAQIDSAKMICDFMRKHGTQQVHTTMKDFVIKQKIVNEDELENYQARLNDDWKHGGHLTGLEMYRMSQYNLAQQAYRKAAQSALAGLESKEEKERILLVEAQMLQVGKEKISIFKTPDQKDLMIWNGCGLEYKDEKIKKFTNAVVVDGLQEILEIDEEDKLLFPSCEDVERIVSEGEDFAKIKRRKFRDRRNQVENINKELNDRDDAKNSVPQLRTRLLEYLNVSPSRQSISNSDNNEIESDNNQINNSNSLNSDGNDSSISISDQSEIENDDNNNQSNLETNNTTTSISNSDKSEIENDNNNKSKPESMTDNNNNSKTLNSNNNKSELDIMMSEISQMDEMNEMKISNVNNNTQREPSVQQILSTQEFPVSGVCRVRVRQNFPQLFERKEKERMMDYKTRLNDFVQNTFNRKDPRYPHALSVWLTIQQAIDKAEAKLAEERGRQKDFNKKIRRFGLVSDEEAAIINNNETQESETVEKQKVKQFLAEDRDKSTSLDSEMELVTGAPGQSLQKQNMRLETNTDNNNQLKGKSIDTQQNDKLRLEINTDNNNQPKEKSISTQASVSRTPTPTPPTIPPTTPPTIPSSGAMIVKLSVKAKRIAASKARNQEAKQNMKIFSDSNLRKLFHAAKVDPDKLKIVSNAPPKSKLHDMDHQKDGKLVRNMSHCWEQIKGFDLYFYEEGSNEHFALGGGS